MGANQTVYTELRKRYQAVVPTLLTEYPNEKFDKPNPATPWGRFTIIDGAEMQLDIGDTQKSFRIHGQLIIQLFAPLHQGSIDLLKKADTLADNFRNWCGNTVTCREASVKMIGSDAHSWFQVNVLVPFQCDVVH